jgi:hypothetical protein
VDSRVGIDVWLWLRPYPPFNYKASIAQVKNKNNSSISFRINDLTLDLRNDLSEIFNVNYWTFSGNLAYNT